MSDTEIAELIALAVGVGEKNGQPQSRDLRPVWATVTAVTPIIEVRRDGETVSVIVTASAEPAEQLTIGDRVLCWQYESQLILVKKRARGLSVWDSPLLPTGANLNNYTTPGQWYSPSNAEVAGFANKPPSNAAGSLVVLRATEGGVTQFWHGYSDSAPHSYIYRRRLYNGSWSSWAKINDGMEWPKPRRLGMTSTISVPTATDYRTWNWAGIANDPGDVAGGITYAEGGFTVPQAGVYTVSTVIRWLDGAFTQNAELKLFTGPSLNNTTQDECMLFHSHQYMHCAWTVYLEEGYRAEVWLRQISGTARTIGGNPAYNWYQIARVG